MSESFLSQPHFHDEAAAYKYVESIIWPRGPVCPHCSATDRIKLMGGKSTRIGTYKCYHCRKPFTVKVGTIFESSHVPLRYWLQAIFLMASSKKGISSNQLHRTLGITLKSAWFMTHRIREAMKDDGQPLGGDERILEADETFYGRIKGVKAKPGGDSAHKILALVERDGATRAFHVARVDHKNLKPILLSQIKQDTHLMTDGASHYRAVGREFHMHESTNHAQKEYAKPSRKPGVVAHSNTVESFFSVLKRGLVGTYQHVGENHLQRYCTEFSFRFTHRTSVGVNDYERATKLLKSVVGKRLTYRTTH